MKEVRMDWETYQKDLKEAKEEGYQCAIWDMTYFIEDKFSVSGCRLIAEGKGASPKSIDKLLKVLGIEEELKDNEGEDYVSTSSK